MPGTCRDSAWHEFSLLHPLPAPFHLPALRNPAKPSQDCPQLWWMKAASALSFPFTQGHLEALGRASSEWLNPVWPLAGQFLASPRFPFCPTFDKASPSFCAARNRVSPEPKGCQPGEDTCGHQSPFLGIFFGLEGMGWESPVTPGAERGGRDVRLDPLRSLLGAPAAPLALHSRVSEKRGNDLT